MAVPAAPASQNSVNIFISCSWDMVHEAQTAMRVLTSLSAEAPARCDHYHWTLGKPPPWPANRPFQAQIPRARDFDYVIYLAGDRVGLPLPESFLSEGLAGFDELDGYFESAFSKLLRAKDPLIPLTGTIYEVLDALLADRRGEGRCPQLYPFVRTAGDDAQRVTRFTEISKEQAIPFRMDDYFQQVSWTDRFLTSEFLRGVELTRFKTHSQFAEVFERAMRNILGLEKPKRINDLPGLGAYGIEDRAKFFGFRERTGKVMTETQSRLSDKDAHPPFIVIHGESGTGKSSLLRGGVLARLPIGPRARLRIVLLSGDVLQQQKNPIAAFAEELRQELYPEQSAQSMAGEASDDPGQHERILSWLQKRSEAQRPARLVIAIDQMEAALDNTDTALAHLASLLFEIAERRIAAILVTIPTDRSETLRGVLGPDRTQAAWWYVNEPLDRKELMEIVEETTALMDPPLHPEDRETLHNNAKVFIDEATQGANLLPFISMTLARLLEELKRLGGSAGEGFHQAAISNAATPAPSAPSESVREALSVPVRTEVLREQGARKGAFDLEEPGGQAVTASEHRSDGKTLEDQGGAS